MHRRRIRFGLLIAGVFLLLGVGATGFFIKPLLEPDRVVTARFGDVVWNHELHVRRKDIANCQVCHHKERQGVTNPKPCHHCHKPQTNQDAVILADLHSKQELKKYEGENGPPPMTAFHGRCIGCHRAMEEGPVVCRDCHRQRFSGQHGVVTWGHMEHSRRYDMGGGDDLHANCRRCHHKDKEAKTEADYRPCSACHEPAAVANLEMKTGVKFHDKLRHGDCRRCHTTANPEEDRRTCKDCHTGWIVDTKEKRPPLEQAIHERCMECHDKTYAGLTDEMPVRCDDCHEPDPSVLANLEVGLILWNHDNHAKYGKGMSCEKCHHTDLPDQPHMACDRCHGTGLYRNPPVVEALRRRCLGCHKQENNGLISFGQLETDRKQVNLYRYEGKQGSFWWDHRAHAIGWSFSCRNCHHGLLKKGGQYVMAAKTKNGWSGQATHVQTCRNCHGKAGPVAGSAAEGSKAPGIDDAFKKVCLECHVRLGGGPQTWDAFFATEPIEPVAKGSQSAPTGQL